MPQLPFSTSLAANQLGVNPILGWQYEYLPYPSSVILLIRASAVGLLATVYSGSETIQERAVVQAGGTAGVTPSELNTAPVAWAGAGGDRLKVVVDNTTAGSVTIDGLIVVSPR